MKVIHIAGFSKSGKTTFIRELVPALADKGRVGVVKHLGHHEYDLPEGKDTTAYLDAGADISVGIDARRSVVAVRETGLDTILELLCDAGIRYAIIEGFKAKPYPKVVIGEYPGAVQVILTNPDVRDVLERLDDFSDLSTPSGLARELRAGCGAGMTVLTSSLRCPVEYDLQELATIRAAITEQFRERGRITFRFEYCRRDGAGEILLGICAHDGKEALEVLQQAMMLLLPCITKEEG